MKLLEIKGESHSLNSKPLIALGGGICLGGGNSAMATVRERESFTIFGDLEKGDFHFSLEGKRAKKGKKFSKTREKFSIFNTEKGGIPY